MPSDTLFLNHLLNALIWLIFLQKRNLNMKYKRSASPFLCKENRIWIIHTSLSIENNALTLEQATAVLSGIHILGQLFEIQWVRMVSVHINIWKQPPFLATRHSCGSCHADARLFVEHRTVSNWRCTGIFQGSRVARSPKLWDSSSLQYEKL